MIRIFMNGLAELEHFFTYENLNEQVVTRLNKAEQVDRTY